MKILLTGGSGLLGLKLRELDPSLIAPDRAQMDICDAVAVNEFLHAESPDVIIHAAAMTGAQECELDREGAIRTNITATSELAAQAINRGVRLVYLSTDYVYPGEDGPHKESDPLLPINVYSWTKLGGECSVRMGPNSLIIRTTFGPSPFEYEQAAVDKITSKLYVDEAAPIILKLAKSKTTGVTNVGGERRTLYDYARESRPDVRKILLKDLPDRIPPDTSLDLTRLFSELKLIDGEQ